MKATVEVTTVIEVECDSAIVDEIMSPEWQSHYYTFTDREDAVGWLAWVCERWHGPDQVDGLYQIGEVKTDTVSQGTYTVSMDG